MRAGVVLSWAALFLWLALSHRYPMWGGLVFCFTYPIHMMFGLWITYLVRPPERTEWAWALLATFLSPSVFLLLLLL